MKKIILKRNGVIKKEEIASNKAEAKTTAISMLMVEFAESNSYSIYKGEELIEWLAEAKREKENLPPFHKDKIRKNRYYILDCFSNIEDYFTLSCILFRAGDDTYEISIR